MRLRYNLLIATTLLITPATSTNAQEAVDVVNYNQIDSLIDNQVQSSGQSVVSALQSLSGQTISNSESIGKELTNIQDVQDQAKVKYGIDQARLAALSAAQSGPSDCSALESGAAMAAFGGEVAAWREQLADQNLNWFDDAPTINGTPNPSSAGPDKAAKKVTAIECSEGFETASDDMEGVCGSPGAKSDPNASLDINGTELYGALDFSTQQSTAAQLFLSHVVTPLSLPPIPPSTAESPDGARIIQLRKGLEARTSLAGLFVATANANRQPWSSAPAGLADWAKGEAAQLGGAIPETNGQYFPNGVSMMDFAEVRADAGMYDTKYLEGISQVQDPASLLRTLVHDMDYNNWLLWQNYKMEEQIGLMDAAALATTQVPTSTGGN